MDRLDIAPETQVGKIFLLFKKFCPESLSQDSEGGTAVDLGKIGIETIEKANQLLFLWEIDPSAYHI